MRIAERAPSGEAAKDCPQAVSIYADALANRQEPAPPAAEVFTSEDLNITAGSSEAEVQCEFRGAIFVERVDDEWRVSVPGCVD
ncbi:MAG: hypothetical protein ACRDL1_04380 [Solirubrobacterales bacterium]